MGVLVHARFDDDLEKNNGVATVTLLPESDADQTVAIINVQKDDVSVANPNPDDVQLPEIIEIRQADDGSTTIDRLASSTLVTDSDVLDDEALSELFDQLSTISELWLRRTNLDLESPQRLETVTLDFEFKTMESGWPAYRQSQAEEPGRLVVKQVRSLDPGLRGVPSELLQAPIPRDILAYARSIERFECRPDSSRTGVYYAIYTGSGAQPDFGFDVEPLVVSRTQTSPDTIEFDELDNCRQEIIVADPDERLTAILREPDRANLIDS